jgi:hypothetical protein
MLNQEEMHLYFTRKYIHPSHMFASTIAFNAKVFLMGTNFIEVKSSFSFQILMEK